MTKITFVTEDKKDEVIIASSFNEMLITIQQALGGCRFVVLTNLKKNV